MDAFFAMIMTNLEKRSIYSNDDTLKVRVRSKINLRNLGILLLVLNFIVISDDTTLFGNNIDERFITFKYIYIIGTAVVLFFSACLKGTIKRNSQIVVPMMLFTLCIGLSMLVNNDFRFGYIYKLALIIYGVSIALNFDIKLIAYFFHKIVLFLAAISLLGFLIHLTIPSVLTRLPIITNRANNSFYTIYVYNALTYSYRNVIRNYGIFREPGVYQMYLIMAVLFQTYVLNDRKVLNYIILFGTIFTTLSTTGYIAMLVCFILILKKRDLLNNNKKFVFLAIGIFVVAYLFLNTDLLSFSETGVTSVFGKLFDSQRRTTVSRFASIVVNLKMFAQNPIFGIGLTRIDNQFPEYTYSLFGVYTPHNTNTIFIQFAAHGFIYGCIWVYAFYRASKQISLNNYLYVFLVLMILFFTENLTYSGFASLFLAYGFLNRKYKDGESIEL